MSGKPDGYVEVNERILRFYDKYPTGSLQSYVDPFVVQAGNKSFVVYGAAAYRTADDPRPGIGWAWEPVPGPTPFTKDSELMNAETSAWGRAIAALGFEVKDGIASKHEVESARAKQSAPTTKAAGSPRPAAATREEVEREPSSLADPPASPAPSSFTPPTGMSKGTITTEQKQKLWTLMREAAKLTAQPVEKLLEGHTAMHGSVAEMSKAKAQERIDEFQAFVDDPANKELRKQMFMEEAA